MMVPIVRSYCGIGDDCRKNLTICSSLKQQGIIPASRRVVKFDGAGRPCHNQKMGFQDRQEFISLFD
jgi:hypothetical protein